MIIHDHNDHRGALLEVAAEAGELLKFSACGADWTTRVHATPVQVRKLHAALGAWLSENGGGAAEAVTADDVRRIARDEFTKSMREYERAMRRYAREELREMFRSYGNEDV